MLTTRRPITSCMITIRSINWYYHYKLGRPRRGWEDNIRMDLKEIGINTRNWVGSAQDRDYWRALVNAILNLQVPQAMELICHMVNGEHL